MAYEDLNLYEGEVRTVFIQRNTYFRTLLCSILKTLCRSGTTKAEFPNNSSDPAIHASRYYIQTAY